MNVLLPRGRVISYFEKAERKHDRSQGHERNFGTGGDTTLCSCSSLVLLGFVGSHLVDQLLSRGHSVRGYDNLVTGQLLSVQAACASLSARCRSHHYRWQLRLQNRRLDQAEH